jgi:outer membrane receptor protein involved in Fe transport
VATLKNNQKIYFFGLIGTAVSILFLQAPVAMAQDEGSLVLDEVVVTAQRREQSLQDVPVSVEVYSGDELRKQGWRDLDDLANFSPTVLLDAGVDAQEISIRGFGTVGPALTLDQAAPTFIDGIHFGRTSQVKLAFMDVQSVEVLKGPQPVYFGQNATAGAINIRSRRPTDTLEGYVNVEADSHNTQELTFGVGGPINDQWGYRVAGAHEKSGGYLKHLVTGQDLGGYENIGGRVSLQFTPSDRLRINGKVDFSRIRQDSHTALLCRTDGPVIYGRGGPLDDPNEPPGNGLSVFVPPNIDPNDPGINTGGTAWEHTTTPLDQAPDCFSSDNAVSQGGPFFEIPQSVYIRGANTPGIDMRRVADAFLRTVPGGHGATSGFEDIDSMNSYIDLVYTFDNNIELQWLSGYSDYDRGYLRSNINSPFLENASTRGEDYKQFSSELRITSAAGGRVEWNAGAFYQRTDLIGFSSNLRGNNRQTQRYNDISEDVDFGAVFANLTFNFMDDKASLDIGGRYQDDEKFTAVRGYGASCVFDVCPEDPCDPGLTAVDVVFDPVLDGYAGCEGDVPDARGRDGRIAYCLVDPATARFFDVQSTGPFYAIPYRETRDVPEPWWSGNAIPVGLTAPDYAIRADRGEGPYAEL